MQNIIRFFTVILPLFSVGCISQHASLDKLPDSFSIREISVVTAPVVYTGTARADGQDNEAVISQTREAVLRHLKRDVMGMKGGAVPARMIVELKQVDIASGVGRALAQSDSHITASVTIEAIKGKRVIVRAEELTGSERAANWSGNIGIVVGLAANMASAADGKRVEKAAQAFSSSVKTWLSR